MTDPLAEAERVAKDPAAQPQQLLGAVKQLFQEGAFGVADQALRRLESAGLFAAEVRHLRFGLDRIRDNGPDDYGPHIDRAATVVADPAATDDAVLAAADALVRYGAIADAERALERLQRAGVHPRRVARLRAASRQMKRSGILSSFTVVGRPLSETLTRPHEAMLSRHKPGSDRAIVVFTGGARQFWMTLHVLHQYVGKLDAHVVYLSDHRGRMYLDGLTGHARGYPDMLAMLKQTVDDLGVSKTFMMATSAGGYVGLRAAADLGAESFLGLSIRTDLTGGQPLGVFEKRVIDRCQHKDMLMDLRPYLSGRPHPKRVHLYCGEANPLDAAHAAHLDGLPNVTVRYLPKYKLHDIVPELLSRGQFEDVLREFAPAD